MPREPIAPAPAWPSLDLPLHPPLPPMEAERVRALPTTSTTASGRRWQYEPKWDGFRCLAFRDGEAVALQSKAGQPLGRYFPEVVEAVRALPIERCVLDGELVVPTTSVEGFDFDALLQRIHPADTRVRRLSRETPAIYLVFDLLVDARGRALDRLPLAERRAALEAFARRAFARTAKVRLSPATADRARATGWLEGLRGHGFDGVMAKRLDAAYAAGTREAMVKVKLAHTADCVVGGFRYEHATGTASKQVGSLLLGLYDDAGRLHHIGFCSALASSTREAWTRRLEALAGGPGFTGHAPGGPSRWSRGRDTSYVSLRHELVVEVSYDHASGGRFRHGTSFVRARPDKRPDQCRMEQLGVTAKRAA